MLLEKLVVGHLDTNCYIIASDISKKAVVVDPGGDIDRIIEKINENSLDVKYIINTHGHHDHIAFDDELSKVTGAIVCVHKDDLSLLSQPFDNLSFFSGEEFRVQTDKIELEDNQVLELDDIKIQIIHTPGHTKGSISLLMENKLFTGDLLFKNSVGRTDFIGGSFEELQESLKRISLLPDSTEVYPGHGPETTLIEEKRNNPYFNI
jgi:glyoxylase-like metal-dependent hydrolase (beta-lactamase superfamily II)